MHRVASSRPALPSSVSHSVRSFSTPPPPPPAPPRKPVLKWGDVLIPSRQEVNKIKAKRETDISYLKFENQNSLAARLARPTIDITLARQQAQAKDEGLEGVPKSNDEQTLPSESVKSETRQPFVPPTLTPSVANTIEHMISVRREERLRRESASLALKQKQAEARQAREERERERLLNKQAKAQSAIEESSEQEIATPAVDTDAAERRARISQMAQDLAAKRRQERLLRETRSVTSSNTSHANNKQPSHRAGKKSNRQSTEVIDFEPEEEIDSSMYGGPALTGPEQISENLSEVYRPAAEAYKTSADLQIGRIRGGTYDAYVPSPVASSYAIPPHQLGAVRLAEQALSHQRDIGLASRGYTVDLVAAALKPKPVVKK
ncbi:hypothetical protein HYPSUDRAFT_197364 [Hypholoma sublateritium FD-334 SS-4]|uniref:Uncharacterized protein n=1 Tax=Hypholoma sublateritium (strain FD-334 SS-4) TaxID=945553 RepID=A0A0D2QA61_HYPSF|nr:hypothetical protein HYPSUDRAFT_197364 [Hypholoma sublateritium FD-334 SS-4]